MTTVYISPPASQIRDDNGIGRVIHAQYRLLGDYGITLVDEPEQADVIAAHITGDGLPRVDVLSLHGLYWTGDPESGSYSRWHHNANQKIAASCRKALAITVPSPWCAEVFKRDMRLSPEVIGHGVDLDDWEPVDAPGDYLLWNKNRASDVCNPAAAIALAARGAHVVSTFGPSYGDIPETLEVIGTVSHAEMRDYVRNAAVYLATTKETFGIGTLEALAAGVPVLGYASGGTADLVQHQVTGYLARPGDIDGLWTGLEYILKHRAEMSIAARSAAQRFTWDAVMRQYAALYRRVADERRAATTGVSVVITNYNYGEYLDAAITSVLNQTDPVNDIILVDDASTDAATKTAVTQWASDDRIRVIRHTTNLGVAAARNAGIAQATQPFIVCLDADDALDPDYVAVCRQALLSDPGLGIAYTGLALWNGEQLSLNAWPPDFDWEVQATPHNPPSNCIPCAAMFRRSMWERAGGYKQVYAPAEDTEFFLRGLSVGFTARKVVDEGLFHYRIGHDSASRTKTYRPIDTWHPWMRDKQYPLAAPSRTPPLVRSYSEPAVSVVIPVGPGHARYVVAALDSLLGQTCRDWEVIVVDDTIRGGIGDVFDLAAYPFVRRCTSSYSDHGGPGAARNAGLREVRAPLVLFLDADDYLLPTALETMLRAFQATGGKYIYTDWLAVTATSAEEHEAPDYTQQGWLERGQHAVTALLPTVWARDVGGFDEAMPGWEDWDFYIKFAIKGYCGARVAEPLLAYRQATGTVRERSLAQASELLTVLRDRYADYATGDRPMGSCCGGNGDAVLAAKRALDGLGFGQDTPGFDVPTQPTADVLPNVVRMEFIGPQRGAVTFFGVNGRNQYRGGNNDYERYADVQPEDVEHLVNSGKWRVVRQTAAASIAPQEIVHLHNEPEPELVAAGVDDGPPEGFLGSKRRRR